MGELKKRCNQEGCVFLPCYRFTWPGRDEAWICLVHANTAHNIALAMGLPVQFIPLTIDQVAEAEELLAKERPA